MKKIIAILGIPFFMCLIPSYFLVGSLYRDTLQTGNAGIIFVCWYAVSIILGILLVVLALKKRLPKWLLLTKPDGATRAQVALGWGTGVFGAGGSTIGWLAYVVLRLEYDAPFIIFQSLVCFVVGTVGWYLAYPSMKKYYLEKEQRKVKEEAIT